MHKKTVILWPILAVLFLGLASLAQWGQTSQAREDEGPAVRAATPYSIVWAMLGQVNRARSLDDLRRLTGEVPICITAGCYTIAHRLTGSEGLGWAMVYLSENLSSMGYSVDLWNWSASGFADRDLIARKPGVITPTEEIYVVAHVDGVKGTEARYPAADDNGGGAVDLLELARILKGYSFDRTIVLLFSTGEEQGTLGVSAYLDHLSSAELGRIKYAVDIDMVGFDGNHDRVMELWHGGEPPSIALTRMMSETMGAYQLNLKPRLVTGCG